MGFEKLSKLIKQKNLLAPKIKTSAHMCWVSDSVLASIFENEDLKSISFKNGVLKVSVPSPALAQRVAFKKATIISKINEKLQDLNTKVKKISTVISSMQ